MAKPCPVSKSEFMEKAQALQIDVAGSTMTAELKEFTTGSFGWYVNGKVTVQVDGKPVSVQVGASMIVVGSKEAAR